MRTNTATIRWFSVAPALMCALILTACAGHRTHLTTPVAPVGDGIAVTRITEAFVAAAPVDAQVDSITTWLTPDAEVRVIASAKNAGNLLVYDGTTGDLLFEPLPPGTLAYPNGVATYGDTLFVVERDAGRVQAFVLPEFILLGHFGEGELIAPYGLWLYESAPDELNVFITDSYQDGDQLPPLESMDRRVHRYRVQRGVDSIQSTPVAVFGGSDEAGALRWVESITGDVAFNRLAIADEHPDQRDAGIAMYTLDGQYTGTRMGKGLFQGDPEGIALYECPNGEGYWIAADQGKDDNRFHIFDRASLDYLGSFSGEATRNTDGIALYPVASERFPYGVLYAVNDDRGIAAFDWRDIAGALNLWLDCLD